MLRLKILRRALVVTALTASLVGLGASNAFALDCVNLSRPAPAQPAQPIVDVPGEITIWVVQGDWWYVTFGGGSFADAAWDKVPPGTAVSVLGLSPEDAAAIGLPAGAVNGNYQGGQGFGLLDNAQAPCNANRQTQHGIQGDSTRCF
jgi:hypothetical protein